MWKPMTQQEKAEYMAEKRSGMVEMLGNSVAALMDSEVWKNWLLFQSRLHKYSFANCLLIMRQCPEASMVGGYKKFWEPLGYRIRKNTKAISIFAEPRVIHKEREKADGSIETVEAYRYYPIVSVYDVSQMEPGPDAKPLPELTQEVTGTDHEEDLARLTLVAEKHGITVSTLELQRNLSGYITVDGTRLALNVERSANHRFKTIAHELAHYALHIQERNGLTRREEEMDAEAVAFLVANARGLDTEDYSTGYIATWSGGDPQAVKRHLKERGALITKASQWILKELEECKSLSLQAA